MEWVSLAEAAGADESAELPLIHVIIEEDSVLKASDPGEEVRKRIKDRIDRLEGFAKMAMEVVSKLRQEVQETHVTKGES